MKKKKKTIKEVLMQVSRISKMMRTRKMTRMRYSRKTTVNSTTS